MFRSVDLVVDGSSSTYVSQFVKSVGFYLRAEEENGMGHAPRCLQSLTIERVVRDFRWWNLFA